MTTFHVVKRENGLIELACEHGVGHPSELLTPHEYFYGTHGCDGCCHTAAWREREMELAMEQERKPEYRRVKRKPKLDDDFVKRVTSGDDNEPSVIGPAFTPFTPEPEPFRGGGGDFGGGGASGSFDTPDSSSSSSSSSDSSSSDSGGGDSGGGGGDS